ncbi:MAG: efflux RND transporter periplasmic adaptor subunit [Melioribacteraceae bacterium]
MKNKISVFITIIIAALFISNCSEKKEEKKSEEIIPVKITKIIEEEISLPIHTSGRLKSDKEVTLSFKTGGIVSKIFVEEGQVVKAGQILAKLKLDEIEAQFNQAKINYEKILRDFTRVENLYKDSVVTLEQFQNVKSGLDAASSTLIIAKFNLNYSTIIAPFSGKIYKKIINENEMVGPGTPIFIMGSEETSWKIICGITDNDLPKFKIGDKAKITFDSQTENYIANISKIAGAANPMNGLFEIELTIKNNYKNLVSGMIASVDIFSSDKYYLKKIPIKSLIEIDGNLGYIFYIKNNIANKKEVEVVEILENGVLVKLNDNEITEIVTEGIEYLNENSKVKIVK